MARKNDGNDSDEGVADSAGQCSRLSDILIDESNAQSGLPSTMGLSNLHLPIRQLVAAVLENSELVGLLFTCGAIAQICSIFLPTGEALSEDLIYDSFVGEGENKWVHLQPIQLALDDEGDAPFVLSCGKFRYSEWGDSTRQTHVLVGRFASAECAPAPSCNVEFTEKVSIARLRRSLRPPNEVLVARVRERIHKIEQKRNLYL